MAAFRRLILVSIVCASCASPSAPADAIELEVAERLGACLGNFRAACLNVRSLPDGEWHPAELRSFDYHEGTHYRVEAVRSSSPPSVPHLMQEVYVVRLVLASQRIPGAL